MEKLSVFNPCDGLLLGELEMHSDSFVEEALFKANSLFNNQQSWLKIHERILILEKFGRLLESNKSELIDISTKEGGKPIMDTIVEMDRAINGVKLALNQIGNMKGVEVPMGLTPSSEGKIAFTTKEPIGVVVSISAFNHPINLTIHQIIPAIAVGCPVIYKPALTTPMTSRKIVDLLYEAGLPEDYCTYLLCSDELSEKLATDSRVGYVSFIGSSKVGWYLRSKLAPGTTIALEHGGVAPLILCEDADLSRAIPGILKGGFYHAGQVCVSVQRVYVARVILDEVKAKLIEGAKNLVLGNTLETSTEVGPIIKKEEHKRILTWIEEAIKEGAELLTGGKAKNEFFIEPTVLLSPSSASKVSTDEVFGPVICLYPFDELPDAVRAANNSINAFQSSVFTQDIDQGLSVSKKMNASAVMINDHTAFRVDWMPFGGRNNSGIGVGGIKYSMEEMTRDKLVVINLK